MTPKQHARLMAVAYEALAVLWIIVGVLAQATLPVLAWFAWFFAACNWISFGVWLYDKRKDDDDGIR